MGVDEEKVAVGSAGDPTVGAVSAVDAAATSAGSGAGSATRGVPLVGELVDPLAEAELTRTHISPGNIPACISRNRCRCNWRASGSSAGATLASTR